MALPIKRSDYKKRVFLPSYVYYHSTEAFGASLEPVFGASATIFSIKSVLDGFNLVMLAGVSVASTKLKDLVPNY